MRIATRLVLALGLTTTTVMVVYGLIALEERGELLRDALVRETETLARSTQIVADNALRDGRLADLDRVLGRIAEDRQTHIAAVLDGQGRMVAGGPAAALECLLAPSNAGREAARQATDLGGWADCGGGVRWVVLPLASPGDRMVLGRRATVLERDMASSRIRIALTTLALAVAAAAAILLVLRRTLSAPLAEIMSGVRTLGGPRPPRPVRVPRSAGELRELASAFNEMAQRLEGKRVALIEQTEERVALERRLRSADKFAALGRLSGGLAHELGSPLNVIAVRADAIEASSEVPEDARRHAREIVAEVERIANLVHSLQHVSRGHPLEPRPVDLARVAGAAAEDVRERAGAAGVALHVEAEPDVVVDGDSTLLRHAVVNLLLNALHALDGQPGERVVRLGVERGETSGRLVVDDNGPGIPPEARGRLFEPFFTTREIGSGMGLGLAISQGVAVEHGGELHLSDREGGGTRATLTLPLQDTERTG